MEKLGKFSNSIYFMILVLFYLKKTQMQRLHQRQVYQKSIENYYRAAENMINQSKNR